jgi:hypothetical protein
VPQFRSKVAEKDFLCPSSHEASFAVGVAKKENMNIRINLDMDRDGHDLDPANPYCGIAPNTRHHGSVNLQGRRTVSLAIG